MSIQRFRLFSGFLIPFNLGIVLWGAVVRATGSGAGCGNHWPLCNGQVVPQPEQTATWIELIHRVTTTLDGILVIILFVWALSLFPKGHAVRTAAGFSLLFIIFEGLIGAGLVRLELVADNSSLARGWWIAGHLANTYLLFGWLTLVWLRSGSDSNQHSNLNTARPHIVGLGALIVLGMSGAVAAVGDTLFPAADLASGIAQDFAPGANVLLRLRLWHPIIAIAAGLYWILLAAADANHHLPLIRNQARTLLSLIIIQWAAGLINLLLLAPVWLQLVHLLLAVFVWINALTLVFHNSILLPDDSSTAAASLTESLSTQ
jgi:heme A synthase